ncbi:MAG TPA: M1 family peptidase, partial [Sphingobacteriaceae bacterium]|nr:M1 family peptidase [Sphingobacteriaceae bacterium]
QESGMDFAPVFEQYVKHPNLPILEFFFDAEGRASCRWSADVRNFNMPVRIRVKDGTYQFIQPSSRWSRIEIPGLTKDNLEVDTFNFYIGILINSL